MRDQQGVRTFGDVCFSGIEDEPLAAYAPVAPQRPAAKRTCPGERQYASGGV